MKINLKIKIKLNFIKIRLLFQKYFIDIFCYAKIFQWFYNKINFLEINR